MRKHKLTWKTNVIIRFCHYKPTLHKMRSHKSLVFCLESNRLNKIKILGFLVEFIYLCTEIKSIEFIWQT